jgi:hypothetical protein
VKDSHAKEPAAAKLKRFYHELGLWFNKENFLKNLEYVYINRAVRLMVFAADKPADAILL